MGAGRLSTELHALRVVAVTLGLIALAGGCGASSAGRAGSSGAVDGRLGQLVVVNAFLPDPVSPSVAAVYLTVRNDGSAPDALVGVSSPSAPVAMLMTEEQHGSVGTMGMLSALEVPSHGQASLTPGRDHAMLENPHVAFKVGQLVTLTLRFERAGSLTLRVPVVPFSQILDRPATSTGGSSGGMSNMPGM